MKLITLKGDYNTSNREIRNNAREPVILKPTSRVALAGMDLRLSAVPDNETFVITSSDTFTTDGNTVTPTPATYSRTGLFKEINTQMGLTGGESSTTSGNDLVLLYSGGKAVFRETRYPKSTQKLLSDYTVASGNPTVDDLGNYTGDATDEDQIIGHYGLPNASYVISWENNLAPGGTITDNDYEAGVFDEIEFFHGLGVSNQLYYYTFNGAVTNTAIAYADNHQITLSRNGNTLTTVVQTPAGVTVLSATFTVTSAMWSSVFDSNPETTLISITTPALSVQSLSDFKATSVDNTSTANLSLQFASTSLANYLGFGDVGEHKASGDPAEITGKNDVEGDDKYPGIQVLIDPFVLESYSYDKNDRSPQSILYVIHSTRSLGQKIAFDVSERIPLSIKNSSSINLNQIRVRFRNSVDQSDLTFTGNPSVTLVVYDE